MAAVVTRPGSPPSPPTGRCRMPFRSPRPRPALLGVVAFADGAVGRRANSPSPTPSIGSPTTGSTRSSRPVNSSRGRGRHRRPLVAAAPQDRYDTTWVFAVTASSGRRPRCSSAVDRGLATSRVLAGTIRRTGDDPRPRPRCLTRPVLQGPEEHEYAVRSVADALGRHCTSMYVPEALFVLHLANVGMHLATTSPRRRRRRNQLTRTRLRAPPVRGRSGHADPGGRRCPPSPNSRAWTAAGMPALSGGWTPTGMASGASPPLRCPDPGRSTSDHAICRMRASSPARSRGRGRRIGREVPAHARCPHRRPRLTPLPGRPGSGCAMRPPPTCSHQWARPHQPLGPPSSPEALRQRSTVPRTRCSGAPDCTPSRDTA